ncbi:RidA family protein [Clostridium tetanomorphum]|uniref:RidA family protein n=2 Tax=Clostridium tetanomorphum TaxID=1553 RepID=A0A923J3C2_CLOTT|nr:RidA family protein [Clostridium tetanomorphum]MBC2399940.1 RidA family protein [Clostridium tetanomorphum]
MKKSVSTKKAPVAIGPYSQGIKCGNLVFISGQLPVDPNTGEIPEGIECQTEQSIKNIIEILKEEGLDLSNVIKTTVFLKDLGNFTKVNEIYGKYFNEPYPARSCIEIAKLPKDAGIEIEVIATDN